jgi:hypothetical protein
MEENFIEESSNSKGKDCTSEHSEVVNVHKKIFMSTKIKKTKNWTMKEDMILIKKAQEHNFKNWKTVSDFLSDRSAIQCAARYKRIRPGLIKGTWTEDQDYTLINLVEKYGKNWSLISKYITNRTGKQIRDRYLNSLDPKTNKEKFTPEEDKLILDLYSKHGTAWRKIAGNLSNRTSDIVKNRFYSCLHQKIHGDSYRDELKRKKKRNDNTLKKKMTKNEFKCKKVVINNNIIIQNDTLVEQKEKIMDYGLLYMSQLISLTHLNLEILKNFTNFQQYSYKNFPDSQYK